MKNLTLKSWNLKSKLAAMTLAGLFPISALANDGSHRREAPVQVSGDVQMTHDIPGGVITVGAEWGHRHQPDVVVVENRKPDVVIVENDRDRDHGRGSMHGRGWERHHGCDREVTVVREEPRREVVRQEVVVLKNDGDCRHDRRDEVGYNRSHEWSDGRQVSIDRQGAAGNYHYYSDGRQVSIDKQGPEGNYHYYEDDTQVSIQDNRSGRHENLYVRK